MNKFELIDNLLTKIEEFILSYSIIVMAIILIGNVIARAVFSHSWTFAEEVGQALVLIVTFVGIGYGAKKGRHISMSAFFDLLPEKIQKIFMYIISSVTAISMFVLAYLSIQYVIKVQQLGRVSPALRIPMYLIYIFVPVGFFLGGIQYVLIFIKNIREKEVYIATEKQARGNNEGIKIDGI